MSDINRIAMALIRAGWFIDPACRAHCIVDGQYGSTGKGVAASLLEHVFDFFKFDSDTLIVTTNAGPNSGHTSIYGGIKIITRQLPIAAVQRRGRNKPVMAWLNAGAIIDASILQHEMSMFTMDHSNVVVSSSAALILAKHVDAEGTDSGPARIASTGKGVGAALADKIMRGTGNVANHLYGFVVVQPPGIRVIPDIIETAQGFSLGINQRFYPHCTSRECTVMQALSDACLHPDHLNKTMMVVRTFPIRVGSTANGYSGGCYEDQKEISWAELGVEPELTTVTKRVRRVFTWSRKQFRDAVYANRPNAIFLNFVNYLEKGVVDEFVGTLLRDYRDVMLAQPDAIILGYGPNTEDCVIWQP